VEFLEVDGSQGEGGGQILRTAIAFSAIQRRPVRVSKIRAGRALPGLKRQHLSALEVIAKAFRGKLTGATEGSSTVSFVPGTPEPGALSIDMRTAASITLVLQAVVPAVALTGSRLSIELTGGTDVPWSPTFDYFQRVVGDSYESVGIRFGAGATSRGYYPRGGGKVEATIEPCESLTPLDLSSRQEVSDVRLVSRCGMLPRHVAERQLSSASKVLEASGIRVLRGEVSEEESASPGSSMLAYHTGGEVFLGADAIGARGKRAEEVGEDAARRFVAAARSGARLDSNLADMLLPLLSLAPRPSKVRVYEVTPHLEAGLQLASQFTSCSWSVRSDQGGPVVSVIPRAD
jgi:RNA 3'-phosphate cyclase